MDELAEQETRSAPVRAIVALGRFWWDFLIGDTPEVFLGAVVVVGLVSFLCLGPGNRTAAAFVLPLLVAMVLGGSMWRAARRG